MLGSDEVIKLRSTGGKVLGTIILNVDEITLRINVGTELGYLDGSFDGSNYGKIEGLLIADLLRSIDDKVIGSYEGIKMVLSDGRVFVTLLRNVDVISFGLNV